MIFTMNVQHVAQMMEWNYNLKNDGVGREMGLH